MDRLTPGSVPPAPPDGARGIPASSESDPTASSEIDPTASFERDPSASSEGDPGLSGFSQANYPLSVVGFMTPSRFRAEIKTFAALTVAEWRAMGALCAVYGLRLMGLYMVLPILSLYARGLPGSTSFLTGMSLGAYGFTNMLLVLPFGILSDKIGRKRVIAIGLGIFAAGSFLAAWAPDMVWLLIGRALQGAGAVSSVVVALVGDVTRPEVRGRAMMLLGVSVGFSFALGVIGGPALAGELGIPVLFLLTGALALLSMLFLLAAVPSHKSLVHYEEYEPSVGEVRHVLFQPDLIKLDAGMFLLHFALTALFVVIPILLDPLLPTYHLWRLYAPLVLLGMGIAIPTMILAEKAQAVEKVLQVGVVLFGLAFLTLRLFGTRLAGIMAGLGLFVTALGLLEPTLTTLLTRYSDRRSRGTAAGVLNMSGFGGAFLGGAAGGLLLENHGDLFLALAAGSMLWLLAVVRMRQVPAVTAAVGDPARSL
jgi:MFS family permease